MDEVRHSPGDAGQVVIDQDAATPARLPKTLAALANAAAESLSSA